jgi:hypothetical protein
MGRVFVQYIDQDDVEMKCDDTAAKVEDSKDSEESDKSE